MTVAYCLAEPPREVSRSVDFDAPGFDDRELCLDQLLAGRAEPCVHGCETDPRPLYDGETVCIEYRKASFRGRLIDVRCTRSAGGRPGAST